MQRIRINIKSHSHIYKWLAYASWRFKCTIGANAVRSNHSVYVDNMFLNGPAVLHMANLGTHFWAAGFLKSSSRMEVWSAMQCLWSLVYLSPPDHLAVEQRTTYSAKEILSNIQTWRPVLHEAGIENPGIIGTVKRYHVLLRAAYTRIRADLHKETSHSHCLQMAVFATNATMRPQRLCPTVLVIGAIPTQEGTVTSATKLERSFAIKTATKAVEEEHS